MIEPRPNIELKKRARRSLPCPVAPGCGAAQGFTRYDDGDSIGRKLNIKDNSLSALSQSQLERGERVFRRLPRRPPSADLERRPKQWNFTLLTNLFRG